MWKERGGAGPAACHQVSLMPLPLIAARAGSGCRQTAEPVRISGLRHPAMGKQHSVPLSLLLTLVQHSSALSPEQKSLDALRVEVAHNAVSAGLQLTPGSSGELTVAGCLAEQMRPSPASCMQSSLLPAWPCRTACLQPGTVVGVGSSQMPGPLAPLLLAGTGFLTSPCCQLLQPALPAGLIVCPQH